MKKYEYIFMRNSGSIGKIREEFKSLGVDGWEYCGIEYLCKEQNVKEYIFKRELLQDVEEITEDQREERLDHQILRDTGKVLPHLSPVQDVDRGSRVFCSECDSMMIYGGLKDEVVWVCKLCDWKQRKYQTLREESLKDAYIGELEFMDIPAKFVFEVHVEEKYADAWRDLLDKKEE